MAERWHSCTFRDLDTRLRIMVSLTLMPLYSWGKSPRYPLDRRLGGSQSIWALWSRGENLAQMESNLGHSAGRPSLGEVGHPLEEHQQVI
jgi:hypothetical protein